MDRIKGVLDGSPFIIALIYLVAGSLWIVLSDQFVLYMFNDPVTVTTVQTYKGWFFVVMSALVILFLVYTNNKLLKNVIQDLKQARNEFKSTFEQAAVGIVHHDEDGNFNRVNKQFCDMLGYSRKELNNKTLKDLIHPSQFENGLAKDKDLIQSSGSTYKLERKLRKKNGSYLETEVTKSIAYGHDNMPLYFIAIIEEITKRKEAEELLHKSLKEKEILLAEIHHRVKNNLALVSALFELQSEYIEDESLLDILSKSRMRLKCLSMIYERFSESENMAYLDFGEYLQNMIEFLSRTFRFDKKGIELKSDIPSLSLSINQAVPCALICSELVTNAHLHAFEGVENPVIKVSLQDKADMITVTVSDNGKGLEEDADFENPSTFGFTIIKTLKKQLKGKIDVEEDHGLTVELKFLRKNLKGPGSTIIEDKETV